MRQKKRIKWLLGQDADAGLIFAINDDNEQLGWLTYQRLGRFKHWCWYQVEDVYMSPGCLQEVRDMQKLLVNTYKELKDWDRVLQEVCIENV